MADFALSCLYLRLNVSEHQAESVDAQLLTGSYSGDDDQSNLPGHNAV
jgi:hypothetical protein